MLNLPELVLASPDLKACIEGIPAEALMALGQIACAYDFRRHYCTKVELCGEMLKRATADERALGHFNDCGEYYRTELAEARAKLIQAVDYQQSAEKYYKKQCHHFRESFSALSDVVTTFENAAKRYFSNAE